jgi:hypothetical protein
MKTFPHLLRQSLLVLLCSALLARVPLHAQSNATATQSVPYAAASVAAEKQAKDWLGRGIPGLALAVAID